MAAVHLEVPTEILPRVGTPISIGSEHQVAFLGYPGAYLLRKGAHVIRGRHRRPRPAGQALFHPAGLPAARIEPVAALNGFAVTPQFVKAGCTPDVCADTELASQQLGRGHDFAQDGSTTQQLYAGPVAGTLLQQVQAFADALFRTLWHGRVRVVFVHDRDVVVDILAAPRTCGAGRPAG